MYSEGHPEGSLQAGCGAPEPLLCWRPGWCLIPKPCWEVVTGSAFQIPSGSQGHPRKNLLASWFCFQEAILGWQLFKELGFHLSHCPNVSLEVFSKYLLNRSIKGHQGSEVFIKTAPSPKEVTHFLAMHTLLCRKRAGTGRLQSHLPEALCFSSSNFPKRSHLTLQAFQIFWYFLFADSLLPGQVTGQWFAFVSVTLCGPFRALSRLCREDQDGDRRLRCGKIVLFINKWALPSPDFSIKRTWFSETSLKF